MRSFFVLGGGSFFALVLFVSACNGRVQREDGDCNGRGRSGFCDYPAQPPADHTGTFPPSQGFPEACVNETLVYASSGPACTTVDFGPSYPPGSVCARAQDCASVCCVVDDDGRWIPADEAGDGGLSSGTDASAADADSADADADASVAAPREAPRNVLACGCVCLTPREACSLVNKAKGLGGP